MDGLETRELTLEDLKKELSNIENAENSNNKYLKNMKKLSKNKIKDLKELKENLILLKEFDKLESKENFKKNLSKRKKHIKKAIKFMEKNNKNIYNPLDIN